MHLLSILSWGAMQATVNLSGKLQLSDVALNCITCTAHNILKPHIVINNGHRALNTSPLMLVLHTDFVQKGWAGSSALTPAVQSKSVLQSCKCNVQNWSAET